MRAKRPSRSIKAMLRLLWLLGGASALAPSLPSCMTAKIESCDVTHLYDCDVTHLYDEPPLDADAGSPPSLLCPGVQVVRRERERAVHVVAFESPREWPSHLRRGRLRRRRREPGGTPRRLLRVKSTGDRPRVLRPRV